MYRFIHNKCGGPAFFYKYKIKDIYLKPQYAILMDGTIPNCGNNVICGYCGVKIQYRELISENLKECISEEVEQPQECC